MDGYYAWMIVATALVLMMTTPGLALFYGGMTRSKSVLNMMMMSYVAMGVVGIVYVLWGWSESFGPHSLAGGLFADPFTLFGLRDVEWSSYVAVCFQLTFAVITAALIFLMVAVLAAILGFGLPALTVAKAVFYGAAVLFFTSLMGTWVRRV